MTKTTEQPHPCNYVNFQAKQEMKTTEQPKCKTCNDTNEVTATIEGHMIRNHPCPNKHSEQPNPNIMVFDQIDGCCDIIEKLLNELKPQTENVQGCRMTHRAWRVNNLKHLKGAFE